MRPSEHLAESELQAVERALTEAAARLPGAANASDGESPACSPATFARAADLLRHLTVLAARQGVKIDLPLISPADEASIDLFWERPGHDLLVNIPADPARPPAYSGEDASGTTLGGKLSSAPGAGGHLIAWLATPHP